MFKSVVHFSRKKIQTEDSIPISPSQAEDWPLVWLVRLYSISHWSKLHSTLWQISTLLITSGLINKTFKYAQLVSFLQLILKLLIIWSKWFLIIDLDIVSVCYLLHCIILIILKKCLWLLPTLIDLLENATSFNMKFQIYNFPNHLWHV